MIKNIIIAFALIIIIYLVFLNSSQNNNARFTRPITEECVGSVKNKINKLTRITKKTEEYRYIKLNYIPFDEKIDIQPRLVGYVLAEFPGDYDIKNISGLINDITFECNFYKRWDLNTGSDINYQTFLSYLEHLSNTGSVPYILYNNGKLQLIYREKGSP